MVIVDDPEIKEYNFRTSSWSNEIECGHSLGYKGKVFLYQLQDLPKIIGNKDLEIVRFAEHLLCMAYYQSEWFEHLSGSDQNIAFTNSAWKNIQSHVPGLPDFDYFGMVRCDQIAKIWMADLPKGFPAWELPIMRDLIKDFVIASDHLDIQSIRGLLLRVLDWLGEKATCEVRAELLPASANGYCLETIYLSGDGYPEWIGLGFKDGMAHLALEGGWIVRIPIMAMPC